VTAQAPAGHAGTGRFVPGFAVRRYRRLRDAHPVDALRWLRTGVLLCVIATAAVCLGVTLQASNDISTARSTQQAIDAINGANAEAALASQTLQCIMALTFVPKNCTVKAGEVMRPEDVTLTSAPEAYGNDITRVIIDLTAVTEDNGSRTVETPQTQYIVNLLTSYVQQSEIAITDYSQGTALGQAGESNAQSAEMSLQSALSHLRQIERSTLRAQRGTWSLNPGLPGFWWALASPFVVLLLLTVATARVLARHFRRLVSGWLLGALAVTAATAAALGYLNARDAASLAADPWASHPVTLTIAMLLFAVAAGLAYRAYQPRLDEYLFRPAERAGEGTP
jgi:ABC-type Na+ efflux pump permease subunit